MFISYCMSVYLRWFGFMRAQMYIRIQQYSAIQKHKISKEFQQMSNYTPEPRIALRVVHEPSRDAFERSSHKPQPISFAVRTRFAVAVLRENRQWFRQKPSSEQTGLQRSGSTGNNKRKRAYRRVLSRPRRMAAVAASSGLSSWK